MNSSCKHIAIYVYLAAIALSSCHVRNPENSKIVTFCQSIDYTDTVSLHNDKAMATIMRDFVIHMKGAHPEAIDEALDIFLRNIKDDDQALRSATRCAYIYLGNPNSSLRDEGIYIQYLEALLKTPGVPEYLIESSEERLRRARLNREGTIANDFHYIDRNGKEGTLHQLKANRTMLIFYDPECPHCKPILKKIETDRQVNAAVAEGDLNVLAVYTEGNREIWEETKEELPKHWSVAYDLTGILDADLYDIPAMPTVYLLNSDKRVLIKDMFW